MTEAELSARLAQYLLAEARILEAQDYIVGQGSTARRLTRANLAEVQAEIRSIRAELLQLQPTSARGRRVSYLRPRS
jgi:hypothetical protein